MAGQRRLTKYERGIHHLFGKRYMWLLDHTGALGLYKVDDRGDEESRAKLKELAPKTLKGCKG